VINLQPERLAAKDMYPVNITLLGFKPVSEVFWGDHIRPSMMLVPDDEERPGKINYDYFDNLNLVRVFTRWI
jgi:hypothetical protein